MRTTIMLIATFLWMSAPKLVIPTKVLYSYIESCRQTASTFALDLIMSCNYSSIHALHYAIIHKRVDSIL